MIHRTDDWNQGFPEIVREGAMTAHLYRSKNGRYQVADQAGWLNGVFETRDAALEFARKSNGITGV